MLRGRVSSDEKDFIWSQRGKQTMAQIGEIINRHPSTVWSVLNPDHPTGHPRKPGFSGRGDRCYACAVQLVQGTNGNGYRVEGCPNGCEASEVFPVESRVA